MNATEALAQAMVVVLWGKQMDPDVSRFANKHAAAIIAALEGWTLVEASTFGQYTLDQREYGAQQERDRLRPAIEAEWYNGNLTELARDRLLGHLNAAERLAKRDPDDIAYGEPD
jgi:hypothetical protein